MEVDRSGMQLKDEILELLAGMCPRLKEPSILTLLCLNRTRTHTLLRKSVDGLRLMSHITAWRDRSAAKVLILIEFPPSLEQTAY